MDKKRILVVDDEKDIVEIICDLLKGDGYRTLAAYDGDQALQMIGREPPDLVILDIKMPVVDGFAVIETVRAIPSLVSTPIIVLTATQIIQEVEDRLKNFNIQTCISKPFEPTELLAAVKRGLEKG